MSRAQERVRAQRTGGLDAGASLAGVLVDEARALVGPEHVARLDLEELLELARRALHDEVIAECERAALDEAARDEHEAQERTRAERFVRARVERVLDALLARAAAQAGLERAPHAPRVVVSRGEPLPASWAELEQGLETLAAEHPSLRVESELPSWSRCEGRVLVLADGAGLDRLLTSLEQLAVGEKPLRLRFKAGLDGALQTVGLEDAEGVEVVELATALRELEHTLAAALARTRDEADATLTEAETPSSDADSSGEAGRRAEGDLCGVLLDGKYEVLSRIASGGFARVYRARDLRLGNLVAIKVLRQRPGCSARDLAELRDEARRLTRLDHPNIVDWKAFDETPDGTGYIVMELLEGEDLESVIRREGPLEPRRAAQLLLQVVDALRAAHGVGILHLDLKPRNAILLPPSEGHRAERLKVIDFGIAQLSSEPTPGAVPGDELLEAHDGTLRSWRDASAGVVDSQGRARASACTPEYAAPEHGAHLLADLPIEPLDGRADLYSVGVIAYQMLTGGLPYPELARRQDLLRLKLVRDATPLPRTGRRLPRELASFVERCLRRERGERFADADEAFAALQRIVHPPMAKRVLAGAALALAPCALALWWLWPEAGPAPLDLYAPEGASERALAGERLDLGPRRTRVELRVSGLASGEHVAGARLVATRASDAPALEGFAAALAGDERVLVSAQGGAGREQRQAYLELALDDGTRRWSAPFEAVWIGAEALRIEDARVEHLAGRALDPRGAELSLRVTGEADDLARVSVALGGARRVAELDPARSGPQGTLFRVALDELGGAPGVQSFVLRALDRAGLARTRTLSVPLVLGDLGWSALELGAPRFGARYSMAPGVRPTLRVATNRVAEHAWRVLDEGGRELASGSTPAALEVELELPDFASLREGASFDGTLEVLADESAFVHHPRGGGRVQASLPFSYRREGAQLALFAVLDPARPELRAESGARLFTALRELELRLARGGDVPLVCALECTRESEPAAAPRLVRLLERASGSERLRVPLEREGCYTLRVRAWRALDPSGLAAGLPPGEPELELAAQLVVDRTPAELALEAPRGEVVLRSRAEAAPALVLRAREPEKRLGDRATPLRVRWTLARAGSDARVALAPVASGELEHELVADAPLPWSLPLPWELLEEGAELDGPWLLQVEGVDAGGLAARAASLAFEVALEGPRLELASPLASAPWERGEHGFGLRVAARDPNGVRSLRVALRRAEPTREDAGERDEPGGVSAVLRAAAREGEASLWEAELELPEAWSQAELELELVAEDLRGARTLERVRRRAGRVERVLPLVLEARSPADALTRLRLVRGNVDGAYVFGGRVDDLEQQLFARTGMGTYNALATPRSWQVEYPQGEIESFYLDEHEVSAEQLLAFVRDENAWTLPSLWRRGRAPAPERRMRLRAELEALSPRTPAVGATWDEADAYARWLGKRLPSVVELEYALRGGRSYRAGPSSAGPSGAGSSELDAPRSLARGPAGLVAVDAGEERTPEGLWHLCGNAAEWSATPVRFELAPQDDVAFTPPGGVARYLAAHRREALAPDSLEVIERAERFWVVGASCASARRDFSVLDRRRRETTDTLLGFRCALSVERALQAAGEPGRVLYRASHP